MEVQNFISEAMIALVNANQALAMERQAKQVFSGPKDVPEGLRLTLTDEASPVRLQHGETWMDLSFKEAAALWLDLGQIGQVREYAEELRNG